MAMTMAMAPLIDYYDHAAASDNRKQSAKKLYHAVRKCDSLKAPAIFFDWEDCNFYLDNDENEGAVDWKSFEQLFDAVKYLTLKEVPQQRNRHPLDVIVSAAVGETTTTPDVDSQRKSSHLNESLKIPKAAAAAASKKISPVPTKLFSSPAASSPNTNSLAAETAAGLLLEGIKEDTWKQKFQLLTAFQAEHGTCDCFAIGQADSDKYKGLYKWVRTIIFFAGEWNLGDVLL
jgi:hypothetical protein